MYMLLMFEYSIDGVMDIERYFDDKIDQKQCAYFHSAVVECYGQYIPSVEIKIIGEDAASIVPITSEDYIREHLEFIQSDKFKNVSFNYGLALCNAAEDEVFERYLFKFTSDNLLDFEDYNKQYVLAAISALANETINNISYKDNFVSKYNDLIGDLEDVITRAVKGKDISNEAVKDYISSLMTGSTASSENAKSVKNVVDKYLSDEIKSYYSKYSCGLDIWDNFASVSENLRICSNYTIALEAYRKCSQENQKAIKGLRDMLDPEKEKALIKTFDDFINSTENEEAFKAQLKNISKTFIKSTYDLTEDIVVGAGKEFLNDKVREILVNYGYPASQIDSFFSEVSDATLILKLGVDIINLFANGDDIYAGLTALKYLKSSVDASHKYLMQTILDFSKSQTLDDARQFDSAYKLYKQYQIMACEAAMKVVNSEYSAFFNKLIQQDEEVRKDTKNSMLDCLSYEQVLKNTYCHVEGHEVLNDSTKVVCVACPTEVTVTSKSGQKVAFASNSHCESYDNKVTVFVYDNEKYICLPTDEDYDISISSTDDGKMNYSVYEYNGDYKKTRTVIFSDIELSKGDVFNSTVTAQSNPESGSYALTKNGKDVACDKTVFNNTAVSISAKINKSRLTAGQKGQITVTFNPVDTEYKAVTYTSSDNSVATVDENGQVTALKKGDTIITVVSTDGGYVCQVKVTVLCNHSKCTEIVTTKPTCKTEGIKVTHCEICGEDIKSEKINKVAHTTVVVAGKNPTCTEDGLTDGKACSVCGETIDAQTAIKAFGHSDSDKDGKCDFCGLQLENDKAEECDHICHKGGIQGFIYKIIRVFWKLFRTNKYCECGAQHY